MGPCIPNIRIPGPIGPVDSALNTHDGLYTTTQHSAHEHQSLHQSMKSMMGSALWERTMLTL